jgi:hypothetical protein
MKLAVTALVVLATLLLTACGDSAVHAASGPTVLSGTVPVPVGTNVAAGACASFGTAVAGATSSMGVVASPASDPQNAGLASPIVISGFVDAPDHVTVRVCKIALPSVTSTAEIIINVKVIG